MLSDRQVSEVGRWRDCEKLEAGGGGDTGVGIYVSLLVRMTSSC